MNNKTRETLKKYVPKDMELSKRRKMYRLLIEAFTENSRKFTHMLKVYWFGGKNI